MNLREQPYLPPEKFHTFQPHPPNRDYKFGRRESRNLLHHKMIPNLKILREVSTVMKISKTRLALFLLFVFRFRKQYESRVVSF